MPWRQIRYLLDAEVQSSDDATKIVKLPLSNVLHSLFVKVACTTGATSGQDIDIDDVVDKIEVIANGSEVLFSMTPAEIRRWALIEYGTPIPEKVDESASATMWAVYPILFGFEEWDPNFWLPCARFTDLELRIKYSPSISATAWTTGTTTITVIAFMTMGGNPGAYQGTLRHTTIYDFTTAASGDEVIDLPRRLLYSKLLVYCYEAGIEDGVDITDIKFSLNNDQLIPLNLDWDDLSDLNQMMLSLYPKRTMKLYRADTDVVHTKLARIASVQLCPLVAEKSATVSAIAGDAVTLKLNDQATQAVNEGGTATYTIHADETTDRNILLLAEGRGIPHAVLIDFLMLNGGQFFDPTKYDMVQLILTQGGAGGDAKVSLQEVLKVA